MTDEDEEEAEEVDQDQRFPLFSNQRLKGMTFLATIRRSRQSPQSRQTQRSEAMSLAQAPQTLPTNKQCWELIPRGAWGQDGASFVSD